MENIVQPTELKKPNKFIAFCKKHFEETFAIISATLIVVLMLLIFLFTDVPAGSSNENKWIMFAILSGFIYLFILSLLVIGSALRRHKLKKAKKLEEQKPTKGLV